MSRTCSLFQLWHSSPDTRLLLSISKGGKYLTTSARRSYPGVCFRKGLQTSAYEVVKGSYVPTAQIKQEGKAEISGYHTIDRKRGDNLEKLTLAVLSHLPTAVLYVHDLSGECGMSPSNQFVIYNEIKEKFGDHLWLDVVSKCDLLQESPVIFATDSLEIYLKSGPEGALHVSVESEVGLPEVKSQLKCLLYSS